MSNFLLEMKNISKSFPGVKALQGVNFQLLPGEIHALLGENGAGKSTLIKVLGGIYIAEEGEIYIDGKQVAINSVNAARENGISIIHQELVQVPHMTVAENIFLGREYMGKFGVDTRRMIAESQKMLDRFDLGIDAASEIYDLSIAQQQMVEIVKAISFNCRILVMDEPTSSISDREVEQLFEIMRNLAKQGVGIIYISHKMSELNEVCDRVTVLRDGTYVGTRVVADTPREDLIAMMVGRELDQYYTRDHVKNTPVFFKAEHIDDGKKHHKRVNDVTFEVRQGEIVGFAGLVGAGRSETMQCIFGLTRGSKGTVTLDGISSYLRVTLPEGWTWEQAGGTVDGTVYALYPEDDPDFKVELRLWNDGFPGLCGTDMSFSEYTLADGRKASIIYEVSDEEIWWWLILPESPDAFSIQFGVPYALYEAHRAELEQLLGTIQLGVLASLDGPDVVETEEATG